MAKAKTPAHKVVMTEGKSEIISPNFDLFLNRFTKKA